MDTHLTYQSTEEKPCELLAENTGGKYYFGTSTDIIGIYEEIADDLKEEAGVDTVLNLNYITIEINDDILSGD